MRSGRPRGLGKAFRNAGGEAPHLFEGFPGPPGPARPQKFTPKNLARLPSGTQVAAPSENGTGHRHMKRLVYIIYYILCTMIYYILYTIYYNLYAIYYILYAVCYILYTIRAQRGPRPMSAAGPGSGAPVAAGRPVRRGLCDGPCRPDGLERVPGVFVFFFFFKPKSASPSKCMTILSGTRKSSRSSHPEPQLRTTLS